MRMWFKNMFFNVGVVQLNRDDWPQAGIVPDLSLIQMYQVRLAWLSIPHVMVSNQYTARLGATERKMPLRIEQCAEATADMIDPHDKPAQRH